MLDRIIRKLSFEETIPVFPKEMCLTQICAVQIQRLNVQEDETQPVTPGNCFKHAVWGKKRDLHSLLNLPALILSLYQRDFQSVSAQLQYQIMKSVVGLLDECSPLYIILQFVLHLVQICILIYTFEILANRCKTKWIILEVRDKEARHTFLYVGVGQRKEGIEGIQLFLVKIHCGLLNPLQSCQSTLYSFHWLHLILTKR